MVANHSGTIALDAVMLTLAIHDDTRRRYLRLLGADLVFRMPFLSEFARKSGATLACDADAERLLGTGELVGVFPEGFKGVGKHYRDRYKLQRFGRGGFVAAALRTGTPIVPVAIVGAEEIYPMLANLKPLARLLGLPVLPGHADVPVARPAGPGPAPSKWLIEFCEPIETDAPTWARPTTRWSCSTWATRSARRSSRPSTSCSRSGPTATTPAPDHPPPVHSVRAGRRGRGGAGRRR